MSTAQATCSSVSVHQVIEIQFLTNPHANFVMTVFQNYSFYSAVIFLPLFDEPGSPFLPFLIPFPIYLRFKDIKGSDDQNNHHC